MFIFTAKDHRIIHLKLQLKENCSFVHNIIHSLMVYVRACMADKLALQEMRKHSSLQSKSVEKVDTTQPVLKRKWYTHGDAAAAWKQIMAIML